MIISSNNNTISEHLLEFEAKKIRLLEELNMYFHPTVGLKKRTASNLFRYIRKKEQIKKMVSISEFDAIIAIDPEQMILNVEGLAPYEKIIRYTLQYDLLPTVAPELKHITIGGAIVGIGIESTCFKNGFVHDGLLEAEVILPNGNIVICNAHNEHADLFYALPNSYGTLGYILRATIRLYPAKPFVHIASQRYYQSSAFMAAMLAATKHADIDFIEGLVFANDEYYLLASRFTDQPPATDDIYHKHIFYKLAKKHEDIYLSTEDYIFRYDPDWFWNIPDNVFYKIVRLLTPKHWRNSGLYKKILEYKNRWFKKIGIDIAINNKQEALIQDWEVPWEHGESLLNYALENIHLNGKPWIALPIKPLHTATLYPLKPHSIYFNLGCYGSSKRNLKALDLFHNTQMMDTRCFSLNGLKMLYSSTLISKDQFAKYYNGDAYTHLKQKYDPDNLAGWLYDKVAVDSTTIHET